MRRPMSTTWRRTGPGTSLGDPIEVQAAGAVLGEGRDPSRPLLIGSVKTNIGHLEAAAGIAGLIKVILSLEHEVLPKHLHFRNPSPHIPWDRLPVRVVDEAVTVGSATARPRSPGSVRSDSPGRTRTSSWRRRRVVRRRRRVPSSRDSPSFTVLPLSARAPGALVADGVTNTSTGWRRIRMHHWRMCFNRAGAGRSHFEHRAALVVDSPSRRERLLVRYATSVRHPVWCGRVCNDPPKTAWLFPGQGSQFAGNGTGIVR